MPQHLPEDIFPTPFLSDKKYIFPSKFSLNITFMRPFSNIQGLDSLFLLYSVYTLLCSKVYLLYNNLSFSRTGTVS